MAHIHTWPSTIFMRLDQLRPDVPAQVGMATHTIIPLRMANQIFQKSDP